MNFYIFLFLLLLMCMYLGQVFGLMIHCDNCREFKDAKRYVYFVPILKIILLLFFVKDCIQKKEWKFLFTYFAIGDKSILILCTIVELLPEINRERQRAKLKKTQRSLKNSLFNFVKFLLLETREDCAAYNIKFM